MSDTRPDPGNARCTTCSAGPGAPCVHVKGDRQGQPLTNGAKGAWSSVGPVHSTRSTDAYLAAYRRTVQSGGPLILLAAEKLNECLQRKNPRPDDLIVARQLMEWAHDRGVFA